MASAHTSGLHPLKRLSFVSERGLRVRSLSGFERHHTLPDRVTDRTNGWVRSLATQEIADDLDAVAARLRTGLGYKRRAIEVSVEAGELVTPDFCYRVEVVLEGDDPTRAVLRRTLLDPTAEVLMRAELGDALGDCFNTIVFAAREAVHVAALIDELEDGDALGGTVTLDYPADASRCALRFRGAPYEVEVSSSGVRVRFARMETPRALLEAYVTTHQLLGATRALRTLPSP